MQAMQMLSKSQDVTADNLANINTPGFKGNKLFYRMFKEQVNGQEITKSVPVSQVDLSQGILEPTGNPFDMGINGDGFFKVEADGDTLLTRDGRFHLDQDGYLVNNQGAKVLGESGAIQLPEFFQNQGEGGATAHLEITKNGTIKINGVQQEKIQMVKVSDPAHLIRKGNTYFEVENEDYLSEEGTGMVQQGYYEKGNVNPLNEMVDMMQNMQLFETQQRAMKTADEMLSKVTTRLSRF
jgi:flagellar basal body rod protein FlgG